MVMLPLGLMGFALSSIRRISALWRAPAQGWAICFPVIIFPLHAQPSPGNAGLHLVKLARRHHVLAPWRQNRGDFRLCPPNAVFRHGVCREQLCDQAMFLRSLPGIDYLEELD